MSRLFELRAVLPRSNRIVLEIVGLAFILVVWLFLSAGETPIVPRGALPKPLEVWNSFGELFRENELIKNICRSVGLNITAYLTAIVFSLPIGFLIGLLPFFRGLFQRPVDAFRYVPLTAVIGLFMAWFGLGYEMKIQFLSFGILIYLLPIVVQRIDEIDDVYTKTVYTLGATKWQTVKTVFMPAVFSRISDDVRVLTAISWTYIIIAESLGNEGGIGALIWRVGQRQGRVDKLFALIIIIVLIGFIQDKMFVYLDKWLFPHKYQQQIEEQKAKHQNVSTVSALWDFVMQVVIWIVMAIYLLLFFNEFVPILSEQRLLRDLFGPTAPVVHLIGLGMVAYQIYAIFKKSAKAKTQVAER
ncbi:MAG: ABC transporter permease subunit [Saprospiraceae bacterium]